MPNFEKLRIWQKANELMIKVHNLCKRLPSDEKYRLKDQAERSSSSTATNIAEASASYYYNNKIHACYIARREATETQNHLMEMKSKNYFSAEIINPLISEYDGLIKGINTFIKKTAEKRDKNKA